MNFLALVLTCIPAVQCALAADPSFGKNVSASGDSRKRYAELITSGPTIQMPIAAWPSRIGIREVNKGYIRRIPYCFVDKRSYDRIESTDCKVANALQIWQDALGGKASRENHHSLGFEGPKNPEDYCCKTYKYGTENQPLQDDELECEWNDEKWPRDALAIHWMDEEKLNGRAAQAELGYTHDNIDKEAGRHWIHVGDSATIAHVAHEIGHILGMSHEHQRWDRDDHIGFRCDSLVGIIDALNNLMADRPGLLESDALVLLCSDRDLAVEYGSPSSEYVKGDGLDPKTQPVFDGPGGMDIDSIMMYSSMQGSYSSEDDANLEDAVLVRMKIDETGKKVIADDWRIPLPTKPSAQDIAFIWRFYPWDDRKAREYRENSPGSGVKKRQGA